MTTSHPFFGRLIRPRRRTDARVISAIRDAAQRHVDLKDSELLQVSQSLRERVEQESPESSAVQVQAFSLMVEAVRRAREVQLYDVQLLASLIMAKGRVAEMQTGEGKTLACAPAAYLLGLTGRGVHIATPNSYLAERDCELLAPAFRLLGASAGLLPERAPAAPKRAAYQCDITYGTGYEFGFDYLRDQLALRQSANRSLGELLWSQIEGGGEDGLEITQRPLAFALIDEIDNVLLDDAGSPLVLSEMADLEASDAAAHRQAYQLVERLAAGQHFRSDPSAGTVQLTEEGFAYIHGADVDVPVSVLLRSWSEYVEKALQADLLFRRDVHYVVVDGVVQIVDASTGRIFADRTWQDGLHQAIEAKERLTITSEKSAMAQITRQRFYRLYERLGGMTGTAAGCEREFRQVYRLSIQPVPLRVASRRNILAPRFFATAAAKWTAIADSVAEMHAVGRPVLVGTRSIDDSERLAELFRERGLVFELLNGRQDASEAELVARAGKPKAITVSTNLAGRGTDIKLGPQVKQSGGLHVVVAECHESSRVDRQLIGRCGRQGDPGSAQTMVSAEDTLVQRFGPWLVDVMQRHAGPDGEVPIDLSRQIGRLQTLAERREYASRCSLLRRDQSRDDLFCQRG